jgi:hypothetical protein
MIDLKDEILRFVQNDKHLHPISNMQTAVILSATM